MWTTDTHGRQKVTPEGHYGRQKIIASLQRTTARNASIVAVDCAMRAPGLSGVRRTRASGLRLHLLVFHPQPRNLDLRNPQLRRLDPAHIPAREGEPSSCHTLAHSPCV